MKLKNLLIWVIGLITLCSNVFGVDFVSPNLPNADIFFLLFIFIITMSLLIYGELTQNIMALIIDVFMWLFFGSIMGFYSIWLMIFLFLVGLMILFRCAWLYMYM